MKAWLLKRLWYLSQVFIWFFIYLLMPEEGKNTKRMNRAKLNRKITTRTLIPEYNQISALTEPDEPSESLKQTKMYSKQTIDILLHSKPSKLLVLLLDDTRSWYTSLLARESGQSYVYATNIIKVLKSREILSYTNKGRRKLIKLTEIGEKIAKALEEIIKLSSVKL